VVVQNIRNDHDQIFLRGHDEMVSVVSVSKKGTFAASGQEGSHRQSIPQSRVIVWDLTHHIDIYTLRGIKGGVRALAFSPDEMFLAGSGLDGSLFIWDLQSGELVGNVTSADVTTTLVWGPLVPASNKHRPSYILFASHHKVVAYELIYSVGSMTYQVHSSEFKMIAGMNRDYTDSCLSPCGTSLMLCTSISDINVYNVSNLVYSATFPVCSGGAKAICASDDYVFVGGGDGTVKRLYGHGSSWKLDAEMTLNGPVTSLTCHSNGNLFAGTSTGYVFEIDANQMQVRKHTQSETAALVGVSFKKSCSIRFATLSYTGQVRVWDLSDYSVVSSTGPAQKGEFGTCLVFDENGPTEEVIAGYSSGFVRSFDPKTGRRLWEISPAHAHGVSSICAARLYLATGGTRGGVRLWSRSTKSQLFEFGDHVSKPVTGLIADCGQVHLLHSCSHDKSMFTYDLKKEKRIVQHSLGRAGGFVSMTQRLDSENEVITAGTDGCLFSWDFDVPDPVTEVSLGIGKQIAFTCAQVSPLSGSYIAASSTDSRIRVWDVKSGHLVAISNGTAFTSISSIAWSPDEKQIVAVGEDQCIYVWNFYSDLVLGEEKW